MTRDLMIAGALVSLVALAFYGALGGHAASPPGSDGPRDLTGMVDPGSLRTISRPPFTVDDGLEPLRAMGRDRRHRNLVADMRVSPRIYVLVDCPLLGRPDRRSLCRVGWRARDEEARHPAPRDQR
jgi:hypothetical protein